MTAKEKTPEDFLPECMEQELILLTKILDVTKRIEVQSREKEIRLDGLAESRQVYVDRLKKCRQMLSAACLSLPPAESERRRKIISGRFPKEECTPEEAMLLELGRKCSAVLDETLKTDCEARARLQRECDRLQELVRVSRRSSPARYPGNG